MHGLEGLGKVDLFYRNLSSAFQNDSGF
jgi:hypothetical protein